MNENGFNEAPLRECLSVSTETILDGFQRFLLGEGYTSRMSRIYVSAARHVIKWAVRNKMGLAEFKDDALDRFARHLPRCRCYSRRRVDCKRLPFRGQRFLGYLRELGVIANSETKPAHTELAKEYGVWMREQRGLAAATIGHALPVIDGLILAMGGEPARLDATTVRRFVLEHIQRHAKSSAGCVTSIVRCFLRWLAATDRCSVDLIMAVPKVPTWRLTKLPPYLVDDDVERLIAGCDRPSGMARRDRAMLLLLARLGLRASEVVGLRLGDFDWEHGRVRVSGKPHRETELPLPQDVGNAILNYIHERPSAATEYLFLTARAPIRAISAAGLGDVVKRLIERTGIQASSRGPHILRHSLATGLLRKGATIDAIGAVLRHCDVNTTAIYAKVDIDSLRQIAQPWPGAEVSPC